MTQRTFGHWLIGLLLWCIRNVGITSARAKALHLHNNNNNNNNLCMKLSINNYSKLHAKTKE